jgi:hypothetical protein
LLLRRRSFGSLAFWVLLFAIPVATHFAWRYHYYGFLLPNTFYAKVSGMWLDQGLTFLGLFLAHHHLAWLLPLLAVPWLLRRDFLSLLFLSILATWTAYILYIGGDRFEFRFLNVILPFLFFLLQEGVRAPVARWEKAVGSSRLARLVGVAAGLVVVTAAYLPNLDREKPIHRHGMVRVEDTRRYAERRGESGRFLRSLVEKGYLTGDELIALGGAGALPYYSGFPVLDFRGLNDVTIAHQKVDRRGVIAHEKWAPLSYLRERGVVIYDVLNRLVEPEGAPVPQIRLVRRAFYQGPVHCVRAEGRCLCFATTLEDEEFRRVFSRFEILY